MILETPFPREEYDARVARVLETMGAAFFSLDRAWRFDYVNAEAERLRHRRAEEGIAKRGQNEPERHLMHGPILVPLAELIDLSGGDTVINFTNDGPDQLHFAGFDVFPEGTTVELRLSEESVRIGRTEDWSWWRAVRRTFL